MATADAVDIFDALVMLKHRLRLELADFDYLAVSAPTIVRVEQEIGRVSPFEFVHKAYSDRKFYWRDREKTLTLAGIGVADMITANGISDAGGMLTLVRERLATCSLTARYYGGFRYDRFDKARPISPEWEQFGGGQMVLPLVEIVRTAKATRLALQWLVDRRTASSIDDVIRSIEEATRYLDAEAVGHTKVTRMESVPSRTAWPGNVARVLKEIGEGAVQKVVLARRVSGDTDTPVAFCELARRTFARVMSASLYMIQVSSRVGFFGASPEYLYQRNRREVTTEAIAGTRIDRESRLESTLATMDFMQSKKDRREVDLVRDAITTALTPLCSEVTTEDWPDVLDTGNVQHLRFSIRGQLKDTVSDADLLSALSPTPAVCGTPSDKAIALIRELEGFDRGWYAGPVGWISRDAAEFAVAIRSALVNGNTVHLYSGAGIVEGSEASAEWDELDAKIATLKAALGG